MELSHAILIKPNNGASLLVPVDKQLIMAGGKTVVEWKFNSFDGKSFASGTTVKIIRPWTVRTQWVAENVVVRICDEKDNYRFGFNGQEKVNEIAGVGNHTTALFWEYDTRLGRRWNLDPKPIIGLSQYVVFGNNPIVNIDPNGDIIYAYVQRKVSEGGPIKVHYGYTAQGGYGFYDQHGQMYQGNDKFIKELNYSLGRTGLTPTGRSLVDGLMNRSEDITIHQQKSGEALAGASIFIALAGASLQPAFVGGVVVPVA